MEAVQSRQDRRVLLQNVSWETYGRLIAEREERRGPRFFYDRGVLEIVSPSAEHEGIGRIIAALVLELAVGWEIDVFDAGHTTFRQQGFERGFEPDGSFYFSENAGRVRGKANMDLDAGDPPPDLVVEVDLTSYSLDKLPIYASMGVREVWRYAGGPPEILGLNRAGEGYDTIPESRALSTLTAGALARFIEAGLTTRYPHFVREMRGWAQRSRGE